MTKNMMIAAIVASVGLIPLAAVAQTQTPPASPSSGNGMKDMPDASGAVQGRSDSSVGPGTSAGSNSSMSTGASGTTGSGNGGAAATSTGAGTGGMSK